MSTLTSVEVAHGAMLDLADRRENAQRALVDFALRALFDGENIDAVMVAAGFDPTEMEPEEEPDDYLGLRSAFWQGAARKPHPREAFATWIAGEFRKQILAGTPSQ